MKDRCSINNRCVLCWARCAKATCTACQQRVLLSEGQTENTRIGPAVFGTRIVFPHNRREDNASVTSFWSR